MERLKLVRLTTLIPDELLTMLEESSEQGFKVPEQLLQDYLDNEDRFCKPGEALFGVYDDRLLVGCNPYYVVTLKCLSKRNLMCAKHRGDRFKYRIAGTRI
jgi:hypothetical protein